MYGVSDKDMILRYVVTKQQRYMTILFLVSFLRNMC